MSVVAKEYGFNGLAGCVQQRRALSTGRLVGVYQAGQAKVDDDAGESCWSTVCEDHGSIVSHRSLKTARSWATAPEDWCEDCRDELDKKAAAAASRGVRPRRAREMAPSYEGGSRSIAVPYRARMTDAEAVYRATADIREARVEHLICLDLDVRHRIIGRRVVGIGSVTGVECHPREVFRGAIMASAAAVIIVHNHPSGDPAPSGHDRDLTDRLIEVGQIVGIQLLDHVVVAVGGFVSMVSGGKAARP